MARRTNLPCTWRRQSTLFDMGPDEMKSFRNVEDFIKTMEVYCRDLSALKAAPGFDQVIMPGVKEADSRGEMRKNGIPLPAAVYDERKGFAEKHKLPFEIRR